LRYRFDDFELDTDRMELRRGSELVSLEPQVFEVLAYLVERHDRVVRKDELIEHIWPERYVSEAALHSRLMSARKAVGDSGQEQRLIRTVHGRGFRFIGEVATTWTQPVPSEPDRQPAFHQEIRFCRAADGTRIAFALSGRGRPLVKAANWLTHLEFDPPSPVWGHVWRDLSASFELVRYDGRGSGLSDWDLPQYSFESWVDDLEAVVDALGLRRFPLLGISQGGAVAIAYAARHPHRVEKLILWGAYGRGRLHRGKEWAERHRAMRTLIEQGWGKDDDVFREVFSLTMIPDGTEQQRRWLTDLQRASASATNAALFHETAGQINVEHLLPALRIPTLVLHSRGDQRVGFEEGRRLAGLIPGARLVPLDSRNHLILEHEAAWPQLLAEIRSFLGLTSA
jgi:DNA-binding winged helix-turn-helix (wHTH) protein/pimeloyl-ACP methyl ester carboxylesterase